MRDETFAAEDSRPEKPSAYVNDFATRIGGPSQATDRDYRNSDMARNADSPVRQITARELLECEIKEAHARPHSLAALLDILPSKLPYEADAALRDLIIGSRVRR